MMAVLLLIAALFFAAGRGAKKAGKAVKRGAGKLKAFMVLAASLPAVAAAAGTTVAGILGELPLNFAQPRFTVARLSVTAPSLVTGNATNSGTINVRQLRGGAAQATIGTLALVAGVNLAAGVAVVIPISGTPDLLAGDVLDCQYVQIGTGLALPAGTSVKAEVQ